MADAQLWMDADRASLQRANRYDEYANRLYVARSLTWKSPPTCEPTWKDQFEHALEASSSLEERPRPDVLNAAIDKIYDELAELVARRSDRPDSALEKRISTCFQRLRELQKQEGDLIRETVKSKLAGSIASGLDILKRADEIRAKYGSPATTNTPTPDSDVSET